jgi:hypothetical protein
LPWELLQEMQAIASALEEIMDSLMVLVSQTPCTTGSNSLPLGGWPLQPSTFERNEADSHLTSSAAFRASHGLQPSLHPHWRERTSLTMHRTPSPITASTNTVTTLPPTYQTSQHISMSSTSSRWQQKRKCWWSQHSDPTTPIILLPIPDVLGITTPAPPRVTWEIDPIPLICRR